MEAEGWEENAKGYRLIKWMGKQMWYSVAKKWNYLHYRDKLIKSWGSEWLIKTGIQRDLAYLSVTDEHAG